MASKFVKKIGSNYYLFIDNMPAEKLNETGYSIAEMYLKGQSVQQIAHQIAIEYDITLEDALQDIIEFIDNLEL